MRWIGILVMILLLGGAVFGAADKARARAGSSKSKQTCFQELEQPPHDITAELLNPHQTEIFIKAFYREVEGCDSWQRLGKFRVQLKQQGRWADLNGDFWYPLTSAKYKNEAHGFGFLDSETHDGVHEEREHGAWQPARVRFINFVKNVNTGKIVGHGDIKDQPVKIVSDARKSTAADARGSLMQAGSPHPPLINTGYADRPIEPTQFSPANVGTWFPAEDDNYLNDIHWTSWGEAEAVGSGQVPLRPHNFEDEGRVPVTVVLGGLQQCANLPIYTTYHLEAAPGQQQPEGWPGEQSGTFPCQIGGDGYASRSSRKPGCHVGFLHRPLPDPEHLREVYPGWTPSLPGKGATAFCDLRWTQWGGTVAIGDGLRENLSADHSAERNWPVKLELMHPVWCPRAAQPSPFYGGGYNPRPTLPALAYSILKLTEYGPPRKPSPESLSSYGHQGLKGQVFWQRLGSPSAEACGL